MLPFHPIVANWFEEAFLGPTAPQAAGWPSIAAGNDTLIAAPTGSGKTLTAFLSCLSDLVGRAVDGELEDKVYVVYVSPLKALSNDIEKNLREPLAALAERGGDAIRDIRVQVRTGDTPQSQRTKMRKTPPHILVTTPESLYLLLTSEKSRDALKGVQTVIVDEIHALVGSKRGSHLSLSLERLSALVQKRPLRIGLSATQKPLSLVADFLGGRCDARPNIVDAGFIRELQLSIEVPSEELGAIASHEMMGEFYERIAQLTETNRTILVFVNARRMVEKVAHNLEQHLGKDRVAAHHGSLSKDTRLDAEQRLKAGTLDVIVATASLELGIDIGDVDLVVQLGSPRRISTFLQRVGRAGHHLKAIPKGLLFAHTRDQLVECAALVRAVQNHELDAICMPEAPLDVLAQQMVAAIAAEEMSEDDLFSLVRGAYPYRDLERRAFDEVVTMLSDGIASSKGRRGAYLHRDRVNAMLRPRRGARLTALTSGGAIPDKADYRVVRDPDGTFVGTLDEDFAIESMAGSIFLLGNTSWRIRRVEAGKVRVESAAGLPPNIPFWLGEAPGRTIELSTHVGGLRADVETALDEGDQPEAIAERLGNELPLEGDSAAQLVHYLAVSRTMLRTLPTTKHIVAERFFDEGGGMQLILHAPFGASINRAWGLALRKRFCKSFNFELQAAATDDGVLISLGPMHSFPLESIFEFLQPKTVTKVLTQAALQTPLFPTRFKWAAQRALAVPRFQGGKKVPPPIQRMRTDDLMAGVFPMAAACQDNITGPIEVPDHPIVSEALHDTLHEAMDLSGLIEVLEGLERGDIKFSVRDTAEPSPLGHELINANPYAYLDDAPLEERRARAVQLRRGLPANVSDDLGAFDPLAIEEVRDQVAADPRDAEELHDFLLTAITCPAATVAQRDWRTWIAELESKGRVLSAHVDSGQLWIPAERYRVAEAAFPDLVWDRGPPQIPFAVDEALPDAARVSILRGHFFHAGPAIEAHLARETGLPLEAVAIGCLALEAEGVILRGRFDPALLDGATQWCERAVLARIHRRTLSRLRKAIEAVPPAALMRFLLRWQHAYPDCQLSGVEGALQVVEQLQGFESAADAWERALLRARLTDPAGPLLDQLCFAGEVCWGRMAHRVGGDGTQVTRAAPIALTTRDALSWMLRPVPQTDAPAPAAGESDSSPRPELTAVARAVLEALESGGASFSQTLAEAVDVDLESLADALRELVQAGRVTSDGFGGLRWLLARKPAGTLSSRFDGPRKFLARGGGRWSTLSRPAEATKDAPESWARQLLLRYGVVFRDLLTRESIPVTWRELLFCFRRMEARGEIRGGRFVEGFVGEQFALPEAVAGLRMQRGGGDARPVVIDACDPLNLVGIVTPGRKVPAVSGNAILYFDGDAIASREGGTLILRRDPPSGMQITADLELRPSAAPAELFAPAPTRA